MTDQGTQRDKPPAELKYRALNRLTIVAVLAGGVIVWAKYGADGLAYPYHLVRIAFSYVNLQAETRGGVWLRRVYELLEGCAILWGATWVYGLVLFKEDLKTGKTLLLPLAVGLLAVGALPFVPAVWSLVRTHGWPAVAGISNLHLP